MSLVSEVVFVGCKPMDEEKSVQILGMWDVALEWIKCGTQSASMLSCVVLNRWWWVF